MRRRTIILFVLGLLVELAALFRDHATELPCILRRVAPSYWHANEGIKPLTKNQRLAPVDEGFSELAKVWINHKASENSNYATLAINMTPMAVIGRTSSGYQNPPSSIEAQ